MNSKNTKRALFSSILALVLCFSMMLGTTFAWFTDEVTSSNNIIKSGTLDVELYHGDSADAITEDASKGAIFDYKFWEPGYTQTKYVKIVNNGNLAFKFQLNIVPDQVPAEGEVNLADVIDVYMFAPNATINRETIAAATPVGTLAELMADTDGAAHGILLPAEEVGSTDYNKDVENPRGEIAYGIVLKMQESAGNEYQDKSVGNGFSVQLFATQYTWENDSFDHMYDENADFLPKANVKTTGAKLIETSTHGWIFANTTFQFLPTETLTEAQQSYYRYYHADFVVSADKAIPANAVILPGYYKAYADATNDQRWIGLSSDAEIPANTEIRLVKTLSDLLGVSGYVNYEAICQWGNDGTGFLCGVSDQSNGILEDTTLTVELRLYETTGDPTTTTGPKNEETGEYITIGTYTYTFGNAAATATTAQVSLNGDELDGKGNTIAFENKADDTSNYGIETTGGTISNVTITGDPYEYNGKTYGFRAIYASDATKDIILNKVEIDATYCININDSDYAGSLIVTDSTLNGWISYGSAKEAVFTGCTFGESTTGYANLRPYADTTLTNCEFSEGYTITRNSTTGDAFTIALENCTVDGVAVTADNFENLLCGDDTSAYALQTCTWVTVTVNDTAVSFN